ncbi:hypothetical protein DFJ74DRAFT_734292 [Hyaloraphidium curvatum]|nr:hypothetical protein DFJ74DRAFT_734292 [Hyaloraphidium curvatum]
MRGRKSKRGETPAPVPWRRLYCARLGRFSRQNRCNWCVGNESKWCLDGTGLWSLLLKCRRVKASTTSSRHYPPGRTSHRRNSLSSKWSSIRGSPGRRRRRRQPRARRPPQRPSLVIQPRRGDAVALRDALDGGERPQRPMAKASAENLTDPSRERGRRNAPFRRRPPAASRTDGSKTPVQAVKSRQVGIFAAGSDPANEVDDASQSPAARPCRTTLRHQEGGPPMAAGVVLRGQSTAWCRPATRSFPRCRDPPVPSSALGYGFGVPASVCLVLRPTAGRSQSEAPRLPTLHPAPGNHPAAASAPK